MYRIIPLILAILFQFPCKGDNISENPERKALSLVAEKLNEDCNNISISKWMKVGSYEVDTYIGSFYINKPTTDETGYHLGLFEVTKSGDFNMTSLNSKILNRKNNSIDKERKYEIISDYKYMNGFCLSNGEARYYFVVRPQEDAREVIFLTAFRRKIQDKKKLQIAEEVNNYTDKIKFDDFDNYTLSRSFGSDEKSFFIQVPALLKSENGYFSISYNYNVNERVYGRMEYYQEEKIITELTLTDMEIVDSSYKYIKLKFQAEDQSREKNTIYITTESTLKDQYGAKAKYPTTVTIIDNRDKDSEGVSYKILNQLSKTHMR